MINAFRGDGHSFIDCMIRRGGGGSNKGKGRRVINDTLINQKIVMVVNGVDII